MFSDKQKPRAMNEAGGQPNRIEKNTKIKGDIISEADFRIDGKLDGNVKTSGKVVIGKDGYIHGKVDCVNADIEGSFNGELLVSNLLSLKASAVIEGTVSVSKLSVEPGATFNASCTMKGSGSAVSGNSSNFKSKNEPAKPPKKNNFKNVAVLSGIAFEMGAIIFLAAKGGIWLDEHYGNEKQICTAIATIFGVVIAIWVVLKQLKSIKY